MTSARERLQRLGRRLQRLPESYGAPLPVGPPVPVRGRVLGRGLGRGVVLSSAAGGLPAPRPDQDLEASAAGVAPGTATGTLRARVVIVSGTGAGVFLYNGTPGAGTLVASETFASADPYTNKTIAGGFATYNNAGGLASLLSSGALTFFAGSLAAGWLPAGVSLSTDVGNDATLSAAGNANLIAGNGLANPTTLQVTSGGFVTSTGADGTTYDPGPALKTKSANQVTPAGTTTAAVTWDQGGNTLAVAAGVRYRLRAIIRVQQGAAANIDNFQFTASGAVGFSSLAWNSSNIGAASGGAWAVVAVNSNISLGPAATTQYVIYVEGHFVANAAGTITLNVQCGTVGGTFTVQGGSFMEIIPAAAVN